MFSTAEKKHYQRHFILDKIGILGQQKIKDTKVLVIGAGGLGCPILQYLTAAGIGTIGIVDNDNVSQSNLQRQVLFSYDDIGKPKAACAREKLSKLNPHITIEAHVCFLTSKNAIGLFQQYDIIVDGSDNFQTRYLSNDAAVLTEKPLVFGAVFRFEGQVSVFNYQNGPTYRCLFPNPPAPSSIPNCSEIGVLGVLPGIIGCYQANEVLKIACNIGEVLSGQLLSINSLNLQQNRVNFTKNNTLQIEKLIDYDLFCGLSKKNKLDISPEELKQLIAQKDLCLVDVRKRMEREHFHIGGLHIPLHELTQRIHELKNKETLIFYCKVGQRSSIAADLAKETFPQKNIQNLAGGLDAWCSAFELS
jgi:molybdopterin/thiamine biosynthesis adenylyltransferase/rhodanese-related sulfurtransferase